MLKKLLAIALPVFLLACSAQADEAAIKKNLQERFAGATVKSVAKTPVKGIYEVVMDGQMLYSDEKADYLFVGTLVEAKTQRNITEARMRELFKVNFSALPFEQAIKMVKGDGKRKMVVFSDPECPFCKKLEHELESVNNVTIYTFLYPIASLHPNAAEKSKTIWCAPDRAKAWNDFMLKGIEPKNAGTCETPLAQLAELGKKFNINGTPTIIFESGRLVPGAVPAAELEKMLNVPPAK